MQYDSNGVSRRDAIRAGLGAGLALSLRSLPAFAEELGQGAALVTKPIPSSGEQLPVIGIGTARNYETATTPEQRAPLRDVLRRFPELGGKVIDTAPGYGNAEIVVGDLLAELKNRPSYFIATKVSTRTGDVAAATKQMEDSMRRLRTDRIDLMQIWNMSSPEALLPVLFDWKKAGRIRYVGATTSSERQYPELERVMSSQPLDFIQINYAIDSRAAADRILPLAAERKTAVLINLPFGRSRVFQKVAGKPLPDWASEIDVTSWAQLFLKYLASHPSVTTVIPGTERVDYLTDNMGAARGRMPDAAMRKRIEAFYDAL
jgi:aryl-alcohol dehydrogenase-like predicted oxidoreductase